MSRSLPSHSTTEILTVPGATVSSGTILLSDPSNKTRAILLDNVDDKRGG